MPPKADMRRTKESMTASSKLRATVYSKDNVGVDYLYIGNERNRSLITFVLQIRYIRGSFLIWRVLPSDMRNILTTVILYLNLILQSRSVSFGLNSDTMKGS